MLFVFKKTNSCSFEERILMLKIAIVLIVSYSIFYHKSRGKQTWEWKGENFNALQFP